MKVILFSFGFKHGDPDAGTVLDMRFLPNPYYVPELKERSGMEPDVAAHVLENDQARDFLVHFEPLLRSYIDHHAVAGRAELRLAIGCTGGRHRSVAVTEFLHEQLHDLPYPVEKFHRDIERE